MNFRVIVSISPTNQARINIMPDAVSSHTNKNIRRPKRVKKTIRTGPGQTHGQTHTHLQPGNCPKVIYILP